LVGVIDAARLAAACENARLAATAVGGGLESSADGALDAALDTLRQTPRVPELVALARRWQQLREAHGAAALARTMTRWCDSRQQ
jgi:hypothetical protein